MTTKLNKNTRGAIISAALVLTSALTLNSSCKKTDSTTTVTPSVSSYAVVTLVSDTSSISASRTDAKLRNAWGIAIGPTGMFWIAANHTGSTVVYDYNGIQQIGAVNIPLGANPNGASPSGVVYNNTTDFIIPGNGTSLYIYATEDGIITAWNGSAGSSTITVADRSIAGSVYKGIALGSDGGANFIYATDFHNAKIDVYDKNFVLVTSKPFVDPSMPTNYAPFNIQNIGGQLYVTYAKPKLPDNHDDQAGLGNGYIDIFTTAGVFVKRFASQGTLNSPWGIVQAPTAFGQVSGAILVGNFGDGHISIFDATGAYQAQLLNNGTAVSIDGLWALTFDNVLPADPNHLYYTAGPAKESHGAFGYLKKM